MPARAPFPPSARARQLTLTESGARAPEQHYHTDSDETQLALPHAGLAPNSAFAVCKVCDQQVPKESLMQHVVSCSALASCHERLRETDTSLKKARAGPAPCSTRCPPCLPLRLPLSLKKARVSPAPCRLPPAALCPLPACLRPLLPATIPAMAAAAAAQPAPLPAISPPPPHSQPTPTTLLATSSADGGGPRHAPPAARVVCGRPQRADRHVERAQGEAPPLPLPPLLLLLHLMGGAFTALLPSVRW